MNDTHTFDDDMTTDPADGKHPVDELAEMDPADVPGAAERYAATLAAELEDAGAAAPDPVQLRADLGDAVETN
jgi:hypothetical protein